MNTKRLILMQGVPGSGKSTIAQMLLKAANENDLHSGFVLSTDDYRYEECGHYIHEEKKNHEFHMATQRAAADVMRLGTPTVIIDNTNILREHAYPYIALARMYGYSVDVVRVDPGLAEAKARNATRPIERRVPDHVIERMYETMEVLI